MYRAFARRMSKVATKRTVSVSHQVTQAVKNLTFDKLSFSSTLSLLNGDLFRRYVYSLIIKTRTTHTTNVAMCFCPGALKCKHMTYESTSLLEVFKLRIETAGGVSLMTSEKQVLLSFMGAICSCMKRNDV